MLALGVSILRGLFLILLYLFLFRLTVSMLDQLRQASAKEEPVQPGLLKTRLLSSGGDGASLQVISSGEEVIVPGESFPLGDITQIGRGRGNHIHLSGHYASQEHARITFKQGQYWLEDLGSLNHTFLNEVPVTKEIVLANGDRLRIGEVIFRFVRWAYEMESDN
ncbi:FHA domain-containing protein [Desulforamulus aeronauticus]|uniref:FHA domain-containing protein n=1 Tax=Desulforamulus aeronauticus DSM 10349 TaxID=1121421 RepID=A0A1M6NJN6_9FIRM|nr:FHA domain-containing protein [Desulforamulus aeronauticus]SHJ95879.1 FHA domain-containing protein [Desulforamulus aeronauticus DSM 10349]